MRILFVLLVVLASAPVKAQEVSVADTTVTTTTATPAENISYILAGKPIQDRRTGDVMVLACETTECKSMRFLFFKNGASPEFIGNSIKTPIAPTEKLRDQAMKVLMDEFFITHQTGRSIDNRYAFFSVASVMGGGGVLFGGLITGAIVITGSGAGWIFGIALLGSFMMNRYHLGNRVFHGMSLEKRVTYHEGWNWSTIADRTSHGSFLGIVEQIKSGFYSETHMKSHYDRVQSKKAKLTKKGVIF